jgi:hypothetical protein
MASPGTPFNVPLHVPAAVSVNVVCRGSLPIGSSNWNSPLSLQLPSNVFGPVAAGADAAPQPTDTSKAVATARAAVIARDLTCPSPSW